MDDEVADEEMPTEEQGRDGAMEPRIYLPGQPLSEEEQLECDESAYVLYHQAQTGAPCLSFDVVQDSLGDNRLTFPVTAYIVAGTQAARAHVNNLLVIKMWNLHPSKPQQSSDDESDSEEEDADGESEKSRMESGLIPHQGCVNRVRVSTMGTTNVAASWSETGKVHIWDLTDPLLRVDDLSNNRPVVKDTTPPKPVFTFKGHFTEGYAVDWSPTTPGRLATGDCSKSIHVWNPQEGGSWHIDQRPFSGHTASVEDIQWSPNEPSVFASCSVDKSIRIWDTRAAPDKACMLSALEAHDRDVNVISWNHREPFIVSGGDDGKLLVWDLRQFQAGVPVATFKHHTAPVTTVEWHPTESTVFSSGGSDDQIALWDLAVERDDEGATTDPQLKDLPSQLLFIHQGQEDIKELHWHPQIPGLVISTAHSGFNVFKTISV